MFDLIAKLNDFMPQIQELIPKLQPMLQEAVADYKSMKADVALILEHSRAAETYGALIATHLNLIPKLPPVASEADENKTPMTVRQAVGSTEAQNS